MVSALDNLLNPCGTLVQPKIILQSILVFLQQKRGLEMKLKTTDKVEHIQEELIGIILKFLNKKVFL